MNSIEKALQKQQQDAENQRKSQQSQTAPVIEPKDHWKATIEKSQSSQQVSPIQ